jgi:hypothetical protein
MKSRSKELLDRAIAATVAAIEVYNKPSFPYRAESFAILALNGWELLLKARWITDHRNKERSLYVMERRQKTGGEKTQKLYIKRTESGNPFTHSLAFLAKKLVESKRLDSDAYDNIRALVEMRDSAVHFYNQSPAFAVRLQEIGAAALKNFAAAIHDWFNRDLSGFNLYLMPLSFVELPARLEAVVLNAQEKNFLAFVDGLETHSQDPSSRYSVTVNIEVNFTKSRAKDALAVQVTNDPKAPAVHLTEEDVRRKYPWDYDQLTKECQARYEGFKIGKGYHDLRKRLQAESRFGIIRYLDPGNPKSSRKSFYSPNVLREFDKHFQRKVKTEARS